jgi:hypothetical protein
LVQETLSCAFSPSGYPFEIQLSMVDEYQNDISYVLLPVADTDELSVCASKPGIR